MNLPGSLAVTEMPERDARGRRVAVQRYKGSGPVRSGDVFAVLVDVPRPATDPARPARRMVDVVTAGTIECVTPARGRTRGTWTLQRAAEGAEPETVEYLTRDGAALLLAGMVPTAEEAAAILEAQELRAAAGRGDRVALDRLNGARGTGRRAEAADQLAASEARAAQLEAWNAGPEEFAERVKADALREELDALDEPTTYRATGAGRYERAGCGVMGCSRTGCAGECLTDNAGELLHPEDCAACENDEPAGHGYVPPAALVAGTPAAELVALADRMAAVEAREEAAEARHVYTCTRVEELRAALAAALTERQEAREELAAAHDEAAALWTV